MLKKLKFAAFALGLAMLSISPVSAAEPPGTRLVVRGEELSEAFVYEQNGIPMLPLRAVAEKFGLTVTWSPEDRSVSVTDGRSSETIKIGERPANARELAVIREDGRTYVSADFLVRGFELMVGAFEGEVCVDYSVPAYSSGTVYALRESFITLWLEENASTGYLWSEDISPAGAAELLEYSTIPETDKPGEPYLRGILFRAHGDGRITMRYDRSFAREENPRTVSVDVRTY